MADSFFLDHGEHGLNLGQNGSGKTEGSIYQLQNPKYFPVIMYDTKIEDVLFKVREKDDDLTIVNNFTEFYNIAKLPKKEQPDYILVRPEPHEVVAPELLDKYLQLGYDKFGASTHYLDETYHFHKNGQAFPALLGLLTRGRSKKKVVLMSSQRPTWISRFCITEAKKFYLYKMIDKRDRVTLDSVIPEFSKQPIPPEFHFYHFDVARHDAPELYMPVPFTELVKEMIPPKRKWI